MSLRQSLRLDAPLLHATPAEYTAEMLSTATFSIAFCSVVGGSPFAMLPIMIQAFCAWARPQGSESLLLKTSRGFAVGLAMAGAVAVGKKLGIT